MLLWSNYVHEIYSYFCMSWCLHCFLDSIIQIYYDLFICPFIVGCLFPAFCYCDKDIINTLVHFFWRIQVLIFLRSLSRHRAPGSQGKSMFSCNRFRHILFWNSPASMHSAGSACPGSAISLMQVCVLFLLLLSCVILELCKVQQRALWWLWNENHSSFTLYEMNVFTYINACMQKACVYIYRKIP